MGNPVNIMSNTNYGDWEVYHPEDNLMFRCVEKRVRWYLNRNLVEQVGEKKVRFLIIPKGYGNDMDGLVPRANVCVCCGSVSLLTKHHIVPKEFRRHFPLELKARNSYDVLLLCVGCHEKYEVSARVLKAELYGSKQSDEYFKKIQALRAYNKLLANDMNCATTPESISIVNSKMRHTISKAFPDATFTQEDYEAKKNLNIQQPTARIVHGYIDRGELQQFVEMWRSHFLQNLDCKFLPEGWRVDKKIK